MTFRFKNDTSDDKCHCYDWSPHRDQNANILCLGVNLQIKKVHDFRAKKSSKEGFSKNLMFESLTITGQFIGTKVQIFCL